MMDHCDRPNRPGTLCDPALQMAARSDASAQVKARLDATIARLAAEGRGKQ